MEPLYYLTTYYPDLLTPPTTEHLRGKAALRHALRTYPPPHQAHSAEIVDECGNALGTWAPGEGWVFADDFQL